MGGVVNSVTKTISRGIGDVFTGGLAETNIGGGAFKKIGGSVGDALTGNPSTALKNLGIGQNVSGPMPSAGQMSPLAMLTTSGGAPLLTNIAMGVKPNDALASYFGVQPADYDNWLSTLSPSEQSAISSLSTSLNEISSNTDMRNQAVQKLTQDFPNYMATAIPKYKGIADDATMAAAQKALDQTAAKYAAGGSISSGAMDAAMARTAAGTAEQNLGFGTNLALQDWSQQYSAAAALQSFQQKMLGQGATQGFNAIQNALNNNATNARQTAGFQNNVDVANTNRNDAMTNAVGGFAGTVAGGALFGPIGAAVGNKIGSSVAAGSPTNVPSPNNAAQGPGTGTYFS